MGEVQRLRSIPLSVRLGGPKGPAAGGGRNAGQIGADADYATIEKVYKTYYGSQGRYSPPVCTGVKKKVVEVNPDEAHISTSYIERANLSIRMQNRRFTRLTNAFSKKLDNHIHVLALYFFYNFVRMHKILRMTPAMAAGVSDRLWSMEDIADQIEANRLVPAKRGPHKRRTTA